MGRFSVTLEDEKEILHRLSAFEASKMHHPSQSIQVVLVTTMGLARGEHAGVQVVAQPIERCSTSDAIDLVEFRRDSG